MNNVFKVVFNKTTGVYVAVCEYAKGHGKGAKTTLTHRKNTNSKDLKRFKFRLLVTLFTFSLYGNNALAKVYVNNNVDSRCGASNSSPRNPNSETFSNVNNNSSCESTDADSQTNRVLFWDENSTTNLSIGGDVYLNKSVKVKNGATVDMGNNQVTKVADATADDHAVNLKQLKAVANTASRENYFHVNDGTTSQPAGSATTNKGTVDAKGGATGTNSLAGGVNAQATSANSIAIGSNVKANADYAIVIGADINSQNSNPTTSGEDSIAIGRQAVASGLNSVAIGGDGNSAWAAIAEGTQSTAIGYDSHAKGEASFALGRDSNALSDYSASIGVDSKVENSKFGMALGDHSIVKDGEGGVALGRYSYVRGSDSVAIGSNAKTGDNSHSNVSSAVAIGNGAHTNHKNSIAIGYKSEIIKTKGRDSIAIGNETQINDATNSIALGKNAKVVGGSSGIAIGDGALAQKSDNRSIAIGQSSKVYSSDSIAFGNGSQVDAVNILNNGAESTHAIAIGRKAVIYQGKQSIAIGQDTNIGKAGQNKKTEQGIAIGNDADINENGTNDVKQAISIGVSSDTDSSDSIAFGHDANVAASSNKSIAIGRQANVSGGESSIAMGDGAAASKTKAIAIGKGAKAQGEKSISIGTGNVVSGNKSGAIGDPSYISGTGTYAVGNDNGTSGAPISTNNTFILGSNVQTTANNSVFLGKDTAYVADDGARTQGLDNTYASDNTVITGKTLNFAGGNEVVGVVSVGSANQTRRIQNVAPGEISATSTDAINGSQLYSVANSLNSKNYFHVNKNSGSVSGNATNLATVDGIGGAKGGYSLAAGVNAQATKNVATAIGYNAQATGSGSVAIGGATTAGPVIASGSNALAINAGSKATNTNTFAMGYRSEVNTHSGIAIGAINYAKANATTRSFSEVTDTQINNLPNTALGYGGLAMGVNSEVINYSGGRGGVALGTSNLSKGKAAVAIGAVANATANSTIAIGEKVTASAQSSIAIGKTSSATQEGGVALGESSQATTAAGVNGAYDPLNRSTAPTGSTWVSTKAALSIGADTTAGGAFEQTRQIQGVAAGKVDTDAVNVAQLKALGTAVQVHYLSINSTGGGNYNNDGAKSTGSIAIGKDAIAGVTGTPAKTNATAVGTDSSALGNSSTAIGHSAKANGSQASAFGDDAKAIANNTLAMGSVSRANGKGSTAVGSGATTRAETNPSTSSGAVAVGTNSSAGLYDVAIGAGSLSNGGTDAQGFQTSSNGESTAVGYSSGNKLNGKGNTVIGYKAGANTTGDRNTLAGHNAGGGGYGVPYAMQGSDNVGNGTAVLGAAKGNHNVGIGSVAGAQVTGSNNVAIGKQAGTLATIANGTPTPNTTVILDYDNAVNVGNNTQALANSAVAIGDGAKTGIENAVAIGSNSSATINAGIQGYDPFNQTTDKSTATWTATKAAVSVGADTTTGGAFEQTRQITGVAAGKEDTDAVNVAQLKASQTYYYSINNGAAITAPTAVSNNKNNDGAYGKNALAAGVSARAEGNQSVAIGYKATAKASDSFALGENSNSSGQNSLALGAESKTHTKYNVSLGRKTESKGTGAIAIGGGDGKAGDPNDFKGAQALKNGAIAIGGKGNSGNRGAQATESFAISLGSGSIAKKTASVAIGSSSVADTAAGVQGYDPLNRSTAPTGREWKSTLGAVSLGNGSNSRQITNVAAGTQDTDAVNVAQLKASQTHYFSVNPNNSSRSLINNSDTSNKNNDTATGNLSLAAGYKARASGDRSTAIGSESLATGKRTTATGRLARAKKDDSSAYGYWSEASSVRSTAIGAKSRANTQDGSVALGYSSVASIGAGAVGYDASGTNRTSDTSGVWKSTSGAVSVGDVNGTNKITRQITSVAAGTQDTDAVNVAQLKALGSEVKVHYFSVNSSGGANYNNDGATGNNAIAIGREAQATKTNAVATGFRAKATGLNTSAYGTAAKAQQTNATAVGYNANASGISSSAFGTVAKATGNDSSAFGVSADASGLRSTAVGRSSKAKNVNTSAIGYGANASELNSTAVGFVSKSTGKNSTTLGSRSLANNTNATAVGYGAKAENVSSSAFGTVAKASERDSSAFGVSANATGLRSTAIGKSAKAQATDTTALGFGANASAQNSIAIGRTAKSSAINSTAVGSNSLASKKNATAVGYGAKAEGLHSSAFGTVAKATQRDSSAFGVAANATGLRSTAIGRSAKSIGDNSLAVGTHSIADKKNTTAVGYGAKARNDDASAFGFGANATGSRSTAVGRSARSTQANATALGFASKADGVDTTAVGYGAKAVGERSISIGRSSETLGNRSISIGSYSDATKTGAIAAGYGAQATADYSNAIGYGAQAKSADSVAIGHSSRANTHKNSIALGSQSEADRPASTANTLAGFGGYNPVTDKVDGSDAGIVATRSGLAGVSIGKTGKTRQINHLAAGTTDTDAVNVAQLKAVAKKVEDVNTTANAGFTIAGNSTAGGTTDKKIKPTDTLTVVGDSGNTNWTESDEGKNIYTQISNNKVTIALKKDIEVKSVKLKNGSNETDLTTDTNGLNLGGDKITNVASNLNTISGTGSNAGLLDVNNLNATQQGSVVTGRDLANMGWVISSDKTTGSLGTAYSDQVKNANEVKFVGINDAKVSGKTVGGVRTITVDVNANSVVNNAQLPVVYTKADGTKVYKRGADFYDSPTAGNVVPVTNVIASMNNGSNSTNSPMLLTNLQSTLPTPSTTNQPANTAPTSSQFNNAATVGDVMNSGWNLTVNGNNVDFVSPYNTVNFVNGTATTATVTSNGNVSVVKYDVKYDPNVFKLNANDELTLKDSTVAVTNGGNTASGTNGSNTVTSGGVGGNLTVDAGKNLNADLSRSGTGANTTNTIKLSTADNVEFKEVNVDSKLSVDNGATIDAGNNKIQNVANGTAPNDAVNYSQLQSVSGNNSTNTQNITNNTNNIAANAGNIASNSAEIANNSRDINKGINVSTNDDSLNKQLGDTIEIKGTLSNKTAASSNNVRTKINDKGAVEVMIAQTPKFKGLDSGNQKITGVAAGESPTDAVNVAQLQKLGYELSDDMNDLEDRANAGIAGSTAMAFLQHSNRPGKNSLSFGVGGYKNQKAVAVGYAINSDNNKWRMKAGASYNTQNEVNWGGSVGIQW